MKISTKMYEVLYDIYSWEIAFPGNNSGCPFDDIPIRTAVALKRRDLIEVCAGVDKIRLTDEGKVELAKAYWIG